MFTCLVLHFLSFQILFFICETVIFSFFSCVQTIQNNFYPQLIIFFAWINPRKKKKKKKKKEYYRKKKKTLMCL